MPSILYNNDVFDQKFVEGQHHNEVLGRFFTVWSQVERAYCVVGQGLTDTDPVVITALVNKARTKEVLEILTDIAEGVDDPHGPRLVAALKEAQNLSIKRNKITHAAWGTIGGEIARFSHDLIAQDIQDIAMETQKGNSKRDRFVFTINDISNLIDQGIKIRDEFMSVLRTLPSKSATRRDEFSCLKRENLALRKELLQARSSQPQS